MMLETVVVSRLKPNPFRRLDEYPIIREKVDLLKESIEQTGFWGTIVARPVGQDYQIAFGHHRLVALQEAGITKAEVIIRDLSNEDMIRMMARENMEEWGTSAWVEVETIRATIEAYGRAEIELPKVPRDTRKDLIRDVCQDSGTRPYTEATVAEFLGWTRKAHKDGVRPNNACETAFRALDAINDGLLSEGDIKGLKRSQVDEIVKAQRAIHEAEKRVAKENEENAERARQRAAEADSAAERRRLETQARIHEEQAETHKREASSKAKAFGKQGAGMFRDGQGLRDVREKAQDLKPTPSRPPKIHNVDEFAARIAKQLERIADDESTIAVDFKLLKSALGDLSERAAKGLRGSFSKVIARLERMRDEITPASSHDDGTESDRGRLQLTNGTHGPAKG